MGKLVISKRRHAGLAPKTKEKIREFIHREFRNVPLIQQYVWSDPDWVITLQNHENQLLSFYHIIFREVLFDEKKVNVAGINNVITPHEFRGRGYATKVLKETKDFLFEDLAADYGLLLCSDDLVSFYEKLGWYNTESRLLFDQPEGKKQWEANTMLINRYGGRVKPKEIDLCGLPW